MISQLKALWIRLSVLIAALAVWQVERVQAVQLEPVDYVQLTGWTEENHQQALEVFVRACTELTTSGVGFSRKALLSGKKSDWQFVCKLATNQGKTPAAARKFFEKHFQPVLLNNVTGQFTGYFEPEIRGSRIKTKTYNVPVLARPDDLQKLPATSAKRLKVQYGRKSGGKWQPYFTRQEIEQGALDNKGLEIVYLKSRVDLFFMQVQGSGRIRLADGKTLRLGYAAKSGLPYTSIGKVLIDRGELTREEMSMQALRGWMKDNAGSAQELMWENKSYVFFRELPDTDPADGPVGAQQLPLTTLRSLAIDRQYWSLGVPVWLETTIYSKGNIRAFRQIMVAQDTGSAIKGPARGDIFMGTGEQAGLDAGLMDQNGRLFALLPHPLAKRLLKKFEK